MTDLTKLKDSCEKLSSLLNDPQPGLITWISLVGERMDDVRNEINKAKPIT